MELVSGKVRIGTQAIWPLNLCPKAQSPGRGLSFGDEAVLVPFSVELASLLNSQGLNASCCHPCVHNWGSSWLWYQVLVLIHLIRWHAFIGYVLFFFNPGHQANLKRVIPRERYTVQIELGQSLTKWTSLWAGRTIIPSWREKSAYIFPFWKRNVSYIG